MTEFGDMLERMAVSVRSPDRSVTLVATSTGPTKVEFAPGTFARHNEETLARQLAGVIRVGIAALQRGYDEAVARTEGAPE